MMDATASIVMAAALVFYTIGVWSEKIRGSLTLWHLLLFAFGLICDTWGTGIMFQIHEGISSSFHGITGLIAIILMFIHAIWAAVVLIKDEELTIVRFHRYSLIVWTIWLIPYLSPMFIKLSSGIVSNL